MSRAPAKGAKEKTKAPAAQTPVIAHEIVPGKFNENDWNAMLERDSSEEFVQEIVDEIIEFTMNGVYKKYIERQLLPFTIAQAKDALLQIIEWEFLARDEGEVNADLGWLQDEEPEPLTTDCWAQGSVPKKIVPAVCSLTEVLEVPEETAEAAEEEKVEEVQESQEEEHAKEDSAVSIAEEGKEADELELEDKVSLSEAVLQDEEFFSLGVGVYEKKQTLEQPAEEKSSPQLKNKKPKALRGTLKSSGVSKMTESLALTEMKMMASELKASQSSQPVSSSLFTMPASCQSLLKLQAGRPPGDKDVTYDAMGNVVAVMRINPEKLPIHKVSVKYHVLDPKAEAGQVHPDAVRKNHYVAQLDQKNKKGTKSDQRNAKGKFQSKGKKTGIKPHVPTLLEVMDIAPGVQITDGGHVKKGSEKYVQESELFEKHQKDLQPVTLRIRRAPIGVSDLLDRDTPILRPLESTHPLPPIISHPQNESRVF